MLSTKYRLRLEFICNKMIQKEEVKLADMIWAEKLSKTNRSANELMRKARRVANNPDMKTNSLDGFMNALDLGDPDPTNHRTEFKSADDIVEWFSQEKTDDWRQRD
ncbi:MAG TPA: hypothetical protein DEG69_02145 [Flavobacteriaceae bacterium]|nr:hypothetical protein [Parvibaculum sp.]HBY66667.1 hypothetical protein [Flavobacteriaceae bacterium]